MEKPPLDGFTSWYSRGHIHGSGRGAVEEEAGASEHRPAPAPVHESVEQALAALGV